MSTGPTTHLETEQKYDAEPGFAMPDFAALPGYSVAGPERYELSATYFDTENLDLISHRITLRRRTGGTDDAWHLKLPVRAARLYGPPRRRRLCHRRQRREGPRHRQKRDRQGIHDLFRLEGRRKIHHRRAISAPSIPKCSSNTPSRA